MTQTNKKGFAALYDLQEEKKKKAAEAIPTKHTHDAPTPPTPRTPPTTRTPPTDATHATHPIAPARDFARVPNSVARDLVPAGHFTGKSKHLYDCLYQMTRAAFTPARGVTISKPELMRASGIGSERTLLKNLTHLKELGLVKITYTDGRHEGNTYEVMTPEEAGLRTPRTAPTPPTQGTSRHARTDVPPVPPAESGVRDVGSGPLESSISDEPKTLIKTNTEQNNDDEAFAPLLRAMRGETGRKIDRGALAQLVELLAVEFTLAQKRTGVVSSPAAFFLEHLRRRLMKPEKSQPEGEGKRPKEPDIDFSKCPDCEGRGYWWPEGFEKGVAKCKHDKLTKET